MSANWTPMRQLMRGLQRGEWFIHEDGGLIAILQEVHLGPKKERMVRSVSYSTNSSERVLIGYFPHLEMAVHITWAEYMKAKKRAARRVDPSL